MVDLGSLGDVGMAGLAAVLAGGCGYLAGRLPLTARAAELQGENQQLLKSLDERNSTASAHRSELQAQSSALQAAQTEHALELERSEQLRRELAEARKQSAGLQAQLAQAQEERAALNRQLQQAAAAQAEARTALEAQVKANSILKQHAEQLQEKLRESLTDRGRLQGALQTEQKHVVELQRQAHKERDDRETAELSLAHSRAEKEELSERLNRAEAQLELVTELKALLQPA